MQNTNSQHLIPTSSGFSLLELLIAMTITLAVMAAASTLLATSLRTRTRENQRSNALAAAQRALNIMSREIGNAGYGLTDNGIVVADSDDDSIRVRANLDNGPDLNQTNEDVRFVHQDDNDVIVRVENAGTSGVLATGISDMTIQYLTVTGTTASAASAERVRIDIQVALPAGPQQPAGLVRLTSDVALRNAPTTLERF
ncbi:MAG TPA: prepilin-type N-terminal cleavage/methylation domain-containing protein [Pyrinomonadaceae bacterium]|nr:prepilin-type N-terminal cleavage/methylation domain-containing protein [Pyrinomonadaceae bacterium]